MLRCLVLIGIDVGKPALKSGLSYVLLKQEMMHYTAPD